MVDDCYDQIPHSCILEETWHLPTDVVVGIKSILSHDTVLGMGTRWSLGRIYGTQRSSHSLGVCACYSNFPALGMCKSCIVICNAACYFGIERPFASGVLHSTVRHCGCCYALLRASFATHIDCQSNSHVRKATTLRRLLRLLCLLCLFSLIIHERHHYVANQDDVRHQRCQTTSVRCITCNHQSQDYLRNEPVTEQRTGITYR